VKWSFNASNQITATPAIADGTIYFATWTDGNVYAVNAATGYTVWTTNVSEATGRSGIFSRATPTVADEYLILGVYAPGLIIALFRGNGSVAWTQVVEESPYAQILMSGTAYNGCVISTPSHPESDRFLSVPRYMQLAKEEEFAKARDFVLQTSRINHHVFSM
jgi:outer membrane protein assembly factor BamB